jgi:hypothetical protein
MLSESFDGSLLPTNSGESQLFDCPPIVISTDGSCLLLNPLSCLLAGIP